ncbi:MAG: hypothetical protein F4157_01295 [Synechococcus sp. SB0675_bin_6]|nr:hypothetical protein [Synechococcus sp. SB0675_bin_6]
MEGGCPTSWPPEDAKLDFTLAAFDMALADQPDLAGPLAPPASGVFNDGSSVIPPARLARRFAAIDVAARSN